MLKPGGSLSFAVGSLSGAAAIGAPPQAPALTPLRFPAGRSRASPAEVRGPQRVPRPADWPAAARQHQT